MSNKIQLGFQASTHSAGPVQFFNLSIPHDGKEYKVANFPGGATNEGKPVHPGKNFKVIKVLLSRPADLGNGKVTVHVKGHGEKVLSKEQVEIQLESRDIDDLEVEVSGH